MGNQINKWNNYFYTTVMSYAGNHYSDNISYSPNIPYFSNPSISYLGAPTGDATQADAARSLREMKHVVAYYSDQIDALTGLKNTSVTGDQRHLALQAQIVNGKVEINLDAPFTVYNMLGQQVRNQNLSARIYLVKCGLQTVKVAAKEAVNARSLWH